MNGGRFHATVHLLRPTHWPFLWMHAFAGFLVAALGSGGERVPAFWLSGLVAGGVWAVLLGGPAAGLTAAFSKPHEINGLSLNERPILAWTALGMIMAGLLLAAVINWFFFDVYLMGLVLVICHATPPIRLGQFQLGRLLTLALGLGALTFWSGCATAGMGFENIAWAGPYLGGFAFLTLALWILLRQLRVRWGPVLFGMSLVGTFACLSVGVVRVGQNWYALALFLPPLGAWTLLGVARFNPSSWREYIPAVGLAGLAWVLTDASLVMGLLLG